MFPWLNMSSSFIRCHSLLCLWRHRRQRNSTSNHCSWAERCRRLIEQRIKREEEQSHEIITKQRNEKDIPRVTSENGMSNEDKGWELWWSRGSDRGGTGDQFDEGITMSWISCREKESHVHSCVWFPFPFLSCPSLSLSHHWLPLFLSHLDSVHVSLLRM